ncbi:MAG TPA: hypothetical protein VMV72_07660 [Verrucomicrobiae bacterium]|nr:hypothetical protein [Verrucomicrobiae bacterium]
MLRSTTARYRLGIGITSAANETSIRPVVIFVAIACTNLMSLLAAAPAEGATPLARIDPSMSNHTITVQAVVSSIREPAAGRTHYTVFLTEGGTTVGLEYRSDLQPGLADKLKVGNVIRARVRVGQSRSRGRVELHISSPDAVELITAAPQPSPPPNPPQPTAPQPTVAQTTAAPPSAAAAAAPATPALPPAEQTLIGKIKQDWVGRAVAISGTISGIDQTDKTRRLSFQDRTGEIQVVLGEQALTGLDTDRLVPGRALAISGPVKLLDGKLTVIPEVAGAVAFTP